MRWKICITTTVVFWGPHWPPRIARRPDVSPGVNGGHLCSNTVGDIASPRSTSPSHFPGSPFAFKCCFWAMNTFLYIFFYKLSHDSTEGPHNTGGWELKDRARGGERSGKPFIKQHFRRHRACLTKLNDVIIHHTHTVPCWGTAVHSLGSWSPYTSTQSLFLLPWEVPGRETTVWLVFISFGKVMTYLKRE